MNKNALFRGWYTFSPQRIRYKGHKYDCSPGECGVNLAIEYAGSFSGKC